jgi:hypothetical protein
MTTRNLIIVTATALALVALSGCTMAPVIRAPAPVGYANRPPTQGADPFPKWPVSPGEAERLLLHSRYERVGETGAGAGTTGAEKVTLSFPDDGVVTNVKWKRVDPNMEALHRALRRHQQLAAQGNRGL